MNNNQVFYDAAQAARYLADSLESGEVSAAEVRAAIALLDPGREDVQALIDDLDRRALRDAGPTITISQASELLGLPVWRVSRDVQSGKIPGLRDPDAPNPRRGGMRVPVSYVMREIARRTVVIFDADGTLTPQRPDSVAPPIYELLPGVAEKCAQLRAGGCDLAIASNQSARRPLADIQAQLAWTAEQISAEWYEFSTQATPERYKPACGMLREIVEETGALRAVFVGDRYTDLLAAQALSAEGFDVTFVWAFVFFERPPSAEELRDLAEHPEADPR